MKCKVCTEPIRRNGGYYILRNEAICPGCYHQKGETEGTVRLQDYHLLEIEKNSLLDEFRAFQVQCSIHTHGEHDC